MDEEEGLECPVCMEIYDEGARTPKMLSCLHTICATCIVDVIEGSWDAGDHGQGKGSKEPSIPRGKSFVCPLCRQYIVTDRIQSNRYILAHLRDLKRLRQKNTIPQESKIPTPPVVIANPWNQPPPQPPISTIPTRRDPNPAPSWPPKNPPQAAQILPQMAVRPVTLTRRMINIKNREQKRIVRRMKSAPPAPPSSPRCTASGLPVAYYQDPMRQNAQDPQYPVPAAQNQRRHRHLRRLSTPTQPTQFAHSSQYTPPNPQHSFNPYYEPSPSINIRASAPPQRDPATSNVVNVRNENKSKCRPLSINIQAPVTQSMPKTPVAGHPFIYPKLPPATTFHQRNPQQGHSKAVIQIIGSNTPTIPEDASSNTVHDRPNELGALDAQPIPPSAPPASSALEDVWCRTCEEPGKDTCVGHDRIPLLKDDEVNWIETQSKTIDEQMEKVRRDLQILSVETTPEGVTRIKVGQPEEGEMGKLNYAEIRDTVNTSCDPQVVLVCHKELDRRRIEYRRSMRRKKTNRIKFVVNM